MLSENRHSLVPDRDKSDLIWFHWINWDGLWISFLYHREYLRQLQDLNNFLNMNENVLLHFMG